MRLYRKISVLLSMGIMGIGLITFTIDTPSAQAGDNLAKVQTMVEISPTMSPTPSPTPLPTPSPTPVPNDLQHELYPDIHELIENYLAAKLECSYEAFEGLVTDPSVIDLEDLQRRTEAIRDYQNVDCYTKTGTGEIDYVVYFTYETVIPTIDTPAPSIDYAFIKYNDEGTPQVYLGTLDDATYSFLSALNYDTDVQALIEDVNVRMEEAAEQDEAFKAFWEKIQNIPEGDSEG